MPRPTSKDFLDRRVVYKMVEMPMPHCPVCGEQLSGNNSHLMPFNCSCGIWESDWLNPGFYKIQVKSK